MFANAPTLRTNLLAVGPAKVSDKCQGNVFVSEVPDGVEESLGSFRLVGHGLFLLCLGVFTCLQFKTEFGSIGPLPHRARAG